MAEKQDEQVDESFGWAGQKLKLIGDLRDGILVLVGIVYLVGYIVWSIRAWQADLGLLPALEAQYIVAGIAPALFLLLVYAGAKGANWLFKKLVDWIGPDVRGWKRILRFLLSGFAFVCNILIILLLAFSSGSVELLRKYFPAKSEDVYAVLLSTLFFGVAIPVWILMGANPKARRTFVFITIYAVSCIAIGVGVAFFTIYPDIPQALGGPAPRCAYLDITKTQVAEETLEDLVPVDSINSESEVVRTVNLDVYFSGSSYMLVSAQLGAIRDPVSLALKLRDARHPRESNYLRDELPEDAQRLLEEYDGSSPVPEALQKSIKEDLISLIILFWEDEFSYEVVSEPRSLYEIKKDVIQATTWCR